MKSLIQISAAALLVGMTGACAQEATTDTETADMATTDMDSMATPEATGTIVEVDHPERGPNLTVGCPVKLSASPADVQRSPLLGEHNDEILRDVLGYDGEDLEAVWNSGAVGDRPAQAAE